jgi:glycosyltransferase involved in cell wall biosynthesis/predicted Zn-dependent protease
MTRGSQDAEHASAADAIPQARASSERREWQQAEAAWRQIATQLPGFLEAHWRLAEACLGLDLTDAALDAARRATEIQPDDGRSRLFLARALSRLPDPSTARDAWRAVLDVAPLSFEGWCRIAELHAQLGDPAAATDAAQRALEIRPTDPNSHKLLKRLSKLQSGSGIVAGGSLAAAPLIAPSTGTLQAEAARAASDRQDWESAARAWASRVAGDPTSHEAQYRLAEAELGLGNAEAALAAADRAAELRPGDLRSAVLVGRILSQSRNFGPAAKAWLKVTEIAADSFQAWARLAEAQAELGDHAAAHASVARALALRPDDRIALNLARRMAHRSVRALSDRILAEPAPGQAGESAALIAAATVSTTLPSAPAERRKRNAQRSEEDVEARVPLEADELLAAVLGEHTDERSLLQIGQGFQKHGALTQAAKVFEHLLERSGGKSIPATVAYGNLLFQLGRTAEIRPVVQRAAAAAADDDDSIHRLARLCIAVGENDAAYTLLTSRAGGRGDFSPCGILLGRLLWSRGATDELLLRWNDAIGAGLPSQPSRGAREIALRLVLLLIGAGRHEEAASLWPDHLQLDVDNALELRAAMRLRVARGKPDEAAAAANTAMAAHPDSIWPVREAVHQMMKADQPAIAVQLAEAALRSFQPRPRRWLDLAAALEFGLEDLADIVVPQLEGLQIDDAEDRLRASRIALRLGALPQALAFAQGASARTPEGKEHCRLIARAEALLSDVVADGVTRLPAAAYVALCRRALDRIVPEPWSAGPFLLLNTALGAGGAERQLVVTAVNLARRLGDPSRIRVVCSRLTSDPARRVNLPPIAAAGVVVEDLAEVAEADPAISMDADQRDLLALLGAGIRSSILQFHALFLRLRPAAVHLWQDRTAIEGGIAALMAGVPSIVLGVRSTRPVAATRYRPYYREAYRALLAAPSIRLIANSNSGARDYEDWLALAPESVPVLHNGYDFAEIEAQASEDHVARLRGQLGLDPAWPILGGVLRLTAVKRPLLWLRVAALAMERVPDLRCLLVGEGPLRGEVDAMSRQLGIADRLILPGYVQVPPFYRLMDVCLLTSVTEGLPNVLVEAHAMGVPTVSTRVGGAEETLIEGVTGWTVPDDAPEALAERVIQVLLDKGWRCAASARARLFARERFGVDTMIDKTLKLYAGHPLD